MVKIEADILVVGSGIAGALVAYQAASRGRRVAILEAGPWLADGEIARIHRRRSFRRDAVQARPVRRVEGSKIIARRILPEAVGGLANFYLAASLRMREPELARWPMEWSDLERGYREAEA